jgi:hypothetical protein
MGQNSIFNISSGINHRNLFESENIEKVKGTFDSFVRNLFFFDDFGNGEINLISTTSLIIILFLSFSALTYLSSSFGKRDLFLVFLTFILFEAFLFASYILFFSTYESVRVASMTRYNSALFFALLVLFFIKLEETIRLTKNFPVRTFFFVACITVIIGGNGFFKDLDEIDRYKDARPQRQSLESFTSVVNRFAEDKDKTYFIDQNTNGYTMWMYRYLSIPRGTNSWCWSIGNPYGSDDVWTCPEEPNKLLNGYKYLAVYNADGNFWGWIAKAGIKVDYPKKRGYYEIVFDSNNSVISIDLLSDARP